MNPTLFARYRTPIVLCLLLLATSLMPTSLHAQTSQPVATIVVARLNVRSGPGTGFPRVAQVRRGDEVSIGGHTDGCTWLKIETTDGAEGWISGDARYVSLNMSCDLIPDGETPDTPSVAPDSTRVLPESTASDQHQISLSLSGGTEERPASQIFSRLSPSVALIDTPSGTGSGVLVEHKYLLTNAHVVWPYSSVRVVFPDGSEFKQVPVYGWDLIADLALIGPIETDLPAIELANGEDIEIGGKVYLIGYPAEIEEFPQPTITNGILSRVRTWKRLEIDFFQVDATLTGGQSGGILVAQNGDVIGISTFYFQGFGLASSIADVLPRVNGLLRGDEDIVLDKPPFRLEAGSTVITGTLKNDEVSHLFVFEAPEKADVALEIEGIGRPELIVRSLEFPEIAVSEPLESGSKVARAQFTVQDQSLHFVRVAQPSVNPNGYVLTSTHPLTPYPDSNDLKELRIGATVIGTIDEPNDFDSYEIRLQKGETISVSVDSLMVDPTVAILIVSDTIRHTAFDDDSGGGIFDSNAHVVFRAPADDVYRILVFGYGEIGAYVLEIEEAAADAEVTDLLVEKEIASSAYGGMVWYENDKTTFAILYPVNWTEPMEMCGSELTACFVSDGIAIFINELSLETLPSRFRDREGYAEVFQNGIESQSDSRLIKRGKLTTIQGLETDRLTFSVGLSILVIESMLFVDETEQIAFAASLVIDADLYETEYPIVDAIFESFRYWNTEEITETAAFHFDEAAQLSLRREYTSAIKAYSQALTLDPSLGQAYQRRAWIYYELYEDKKALEDLRQAAEILPANPVARNNHALLYWNLGMLEEAKTAIDQAVDTHRQHPGHHNNRALIYAALGEFEEALHAIDKASELNHGELSNSAQDTRAFIRLLQGDDESALADYLELMDKDFINPYVLLGAGIAAIRTGDEAQGFLLIDRGRVKLEEEYEDVRLNPQLSQLQEWADELYPQPAQ